MILEADGSPFVPSPESADLHSLVAVLAASPLPFLRDPDRAGVDCRCDTTVGELANRARVKVFATRHGTVVAFLYKDSIVPFSRDRFAYGALILKGRVPTREEGTALLAYLESGLHPEFRPQSLKRAFPFTVPL
jgi:hypothetical protein